ncbi:MAG: Transmembrane protease serine 4 [Marteilia pararefringens]
MPDSKSSFDRKSQNQPFTVQEARKSKICCLIISTMILICIVFFICVTLSLQQSKLQRYEPNDQKSDDDSYNIPNTRPRDDLRTKHPSRTNYIECGLRKFLPSSPEDSDEDKLAESDSPWLVTLVRAQNQICRGSLITHQWILTAAHCFVENRDENQWKVEFGNYGAASDGDKRKSIEKILIHQDFDSETADNNIALVKLSEVIQFSDSLVPICLIPDSPTAFHARHSDMITAWNVKGSEGGHQKIVEVKASVASLSLCGTNKPSHDGEGFELCIEPQKKDDSINLSDSGEPIIYFDASKKIWIQLGIASRTEKSEKGYKFITKLSHYIKWIEETVGSD